MAYSAIFVVLAEYFEQLDGAIHHAAALPSAGALPPQVRQLDLATFPLLHFQLEQYLGLSPFMVLMRLGLVGIGLVPPFQIFWRELSRLLLFLHGPLPGLIGLLEGLLVGPLPRIIVRLFSLHLLFTPKA